MWCLPAARGSARFLKKNTDVRRLGASNQEQQKKTDLANNVAAGRNVVRALQCACGNMAVLHLPSRCGVFGTALHHTTQKKERRLLKEAGAMSFFRAIASHSMPSAILSNPLLSIFAFGVLVLPTSLSVVQNLAWCVPSVRIFLRSMLGESRLRRRL